MNIRMIELPETAIIGKAGLCTEDNNISAQLWEQADSCFHEISGIVCRNEDGSCTGFWGAMSDEGMHFLPWENGFARGLYLAGAEVPLDAEAPQGWVKWILPARKYLAVDVDPGAYSTVFRKVIQEEIPGRNLRLSGAVCDYTDPSIGRNSLYFPVEEEPGETNKPE